ncbi:MAG TPA: VWA domain-containing protein [Blastocatellia bacterium]|nr:VWA domain-containing protein [Blastocatellia bacterium]
MKHLKLCLIAIPLVAALSVSSLSQKQEPPDKNKSQQKDKKVTPGEEIPQDEQAIKLGTALVTVPFNVTDSKNKYITDLAKEQIEILEDNKPQRIFSFERQTDLPITVAMVIDISGSQEFTLPIEKAAALRFLEKVLRPNKDVAAVVTFEHESVLEQELTSNVERLRRALDRVRISATSASVRGPTTPPINNTNAGSTALYDSLYTVSSDLLNREAGRRVIVVLTDGVDTSSRVKLRDAIERAWRNEVIIYAIGIRGGEGVDSGGLKKMTSETGGRAFFPGGHDRFDQDLDAAFAYIEEDLRTQYIVSYQPGNETQDGSFRTISVKVKDRKELTVRHRRGYFAPKAS